MLVSEILQNADGSESLLESCVEQGHNMGSLMDCQHLESQIEWPIFHAVRVRDRE